MAKHRKSKSKGRRSPVRRFSLYAAVALAVLLGAWGWLGEWFVHHSPRWIAEKQAAWPAFASQALLAFGNPLADMTDALDWTGHDVVYEYDTPAPVGAVCFAGAPRLVGNPAPSDLRILDRGEFQIGWSDRLKRPVWVAYHVIREAVFPYGGKRPPFSRDRAVPAAPAPGDYAKSGYDRGHLAPNYAIATRYGPEAQKRTFLMSNVVPQLPSLNRGVWRDIEHRIADFWTARYGEIWVVVGALPARAGEKLPCGTDVPSRFYVIILAQEDMDIRAQAMLFDQRTPYGAYAARHLITIDELEALSGLDFNPNLPEFIQSPLEAELPTRLWPIRKKDAYAHFVSRYIVDYEKCSFAFHVATSSARRSGIGGHSGVNARWIACGKFPPKRATKPDCSVKRQK